MLQPDLFDQHLCEVVHDSKRLIVRRNDAVRIRETRRRADKLAQLQQKITERNRFVEQSPRANPQKGLSALQQWVKHYKLAKFVALALNERTIVCSIDEAAQAEDALLDGCYILETDVPATLMAAKTVDERYRDLQKSSATSARSKPPSWRFAPSLCARPAVPKPMYLSPCWR